MFYDPEVMRRFTSAIEPTPEQRFRAEYYAWRDAEKLAEATSETEPATNTRLLRAQLFARVRSIF